MEIIVKKDILDELQAKGFCQGKEEADGLLQAIMAEMLEGISANNKIVLEGLGTFYGEQPKGSISLQNFSAKLSMDKAKALKALEMLLHFFKEMLLHGHELHLMELGSLRVEEKKAQIVKNASTGQKSVVPPKKVALFTPEKKFTEKLQQTVRFEAADDFQKQLSRQKSSSLLLVVPKRDFLYETFEYAFDKAGWKVHILQSIEDAKRLVAGGGVQLVVLDSQMPDALSLCETLKCGKNTCLIPLILMFPRGTDLKKTSTFRICGDEHIIQPFEIKQLIGLAEATIRKSVEEESLFRQQVTLLFPTVEEFIDKAKALGTKLFSLTGLNEEDQISMGAAFQEALRNAAQHGNKYRRDKLLEVLYLLDKEMLTIAVSDGGPGFSWQKFVRASESGDPVNRARQSHKEGKLGGLGIMLMSRCVDKLEYNEAGNVITLTKYLTARAKK